MNRFIESLIQLQVRLLYSLPTDLNTDFVSSHSFCETRRPECHARASAARLHYSSELKPPFVQSKPSGWTGARGRRRRLAESLISCDSGPRLRSQRRCSHICFSLLRSLAPLLISQILPKIYCADVPAEGATRRRQMRSCQEEII